jgi:hypothetical protein
VLVIVLAAGAADAARSWLFGSAAERVMYRLRVRLYNALLRQEVGCKGEGWGCKAARSTAGGGGPG